MDASRGRVWPSPVSLQTSTSCRLVTVQMWLKDILQGSLFMQEEQPCTALCKCHNSDCSNLPDYRMIADEDEYDV